jgi:hypothetical protein
MPLTKITLTNIDKTGDYSELVDSAFNFANSASSYANGSFNAANTSATNALSAGSYANAAFTKANTNSTVAQSGSNKTSSYTLTTADVGKFVGVGTSGSIVIPDSTFAAGDAVTIFNNTSGAITITCSITTAYISGTDTDKASVTLATRGLATVLFVSSTVCVIAGSVT